MELELETFDVRQTVEELIGTIDALVRQNGNTLSVTLRRRRRGRCTPT